MCGPICLKLSLKIACLNILQLYCSISIKPSQFGQLKIFIIYNIKIIKFYDKLIIVIHKLFDNYINCIENLGIQQCDRKDVIIKVGMKVKMKVKMNVKMNVMRISCDRLFG